MKRLQILVGKNKGFFGEKSMKPSDVRNLVYDLEDLEEVEIVGYSITNAHRLHNSRMSNKNNFLLEVDLLNGGSKQLGEFIGNHKNYHIIGSKILYGEK